MLNQLKNLKFSRKILVLGIGSVLFTVVALVTVIAWQSSQFTTLAESEVDSLVDADLSHIMGGVYNLVLAQDFAVQQQVNYSLSVGPYVINDVGLITLSPDTVEWTAINRLTQQAVKVRLPKMLIGDTWLGQNTDPAVITPVVDTIATVAGNAVTIFQRMNDAGDMLQVASNVKGADGRRVIGTYIPALNPDGSPNPVVESVLRGEIYRGADYVVGAWYNAAYRPLRDNLGKTVGMLFMGIKQQTIYMVRQAVRDTKAGKTGYVYVLSAGDNDRGTYLVPPPGQSDGVNVWNTQDATGRYVFQAIISQALTLKPGEVATERYLWQKPGEPAPRWKIDQIAYYQPWHWVIVVSAYEDEFEDYRIALQQGQANTLGVSGLIGLVVALAAAGTSILLARSISRPVDHLADVATQIAGGNLNLAAQVKQKDEIGTLARAFNSMTAQLRESIGSLEQRVAERTAELAQRGGELEKLNQELKATSQEAERRATQLSASAQVARVINQMHDLDPLLSKVTQLISDTFGFYHVGVFLVDELKRFAVLRASNSEGGRRMLARNHKLAVGEQGVVGYVIGTGRPRIASNVKADAVHYRNPDLPDTRSEVALPLQVGGQVFGALDVQSIAEDAFLDEDVATLSILADQVAIAIENVRLFAQAQAALQEAEDTHKHYLREEWAQLLLALPTSSHEYCLAGVTPVGAAPVPEIEQAIRQGEIVIAKGKDHSPARAAVAVPIKLRGQVVGVIDVQEADVERDWTDDDLAVLTAVADQAALALENQRLTQTAQHAAYRDRAIAETADKIHHANDIESILRTAVEEVSRIVGVEEVDIQMGLGTHSGDNHQLASVGSESLQKPDAMARPQP